MNEKRYPRNIMATACIPWDHNNQFDEKLFRKEVSMLMEQGVKSIYLFGTAGEGHMVDNDQFAAIVKAFKSETSSHPDVLPMVGVISLSTGEIHRRIQLAAKEGITDFQISFPSWGAVTISEAFTFFHDICDHYPTCRFMHYNNGLRSKTKLTASHYEQLCAEIPNLVAIKHTAATLGEVVDLVSRKLPLQIFFLEGAYGYGSLYGECSVLISLSNINYQLARDYFDAGIRQDVKKITQMEQDFLICSSLLGLLPGGKMDGAYDKLFVKYAIPEFPQSLFPPYEGISDQEFDVFDQALRTTLPHWFG